jgi:DNA-binding NarL/FixJ family response regulator
VESGKRLPIETLTPRDLDVLAAIRRGSTNGAIAISLGISLSTVRRHVARILSKLDDRPEVASLRIAVPSPAVNTSPYSHDPN